MEVDLKHLMRVALGSRSRGLTTTFQLNFKHDYVCGASVITGLCYDAMYFLNE